MKKLLSFLFKYSPGMLIVAIFASVVSGAANTALIAIINKAIALENADRNTVLLGFIGLCVLLPIARIVAQLVLVLLSQKAIYDLRLNLSKQIIGAPLKKVEEVGSNRLLAVLTNDIGNLTGALVNIPFLCMHVTVIVCCLFYLYWLFWQAALGVTIAMIFGMVFYSILAGRAFANFRQTRLDHESLFKHFESLTAGAKELKLHRSRRSSFMTTLLHRTAASSRKSSLRGFVYFTMANSLGQLLFFIAIGVSIFTLPNMISGINTEIITGYTMVLLYLIIPLEGLMTAGPAISNAIIGLNKVEEVGLSLKDLKADLTEAEFEPPSYESIEYKGITHTYYREGEDANFTLGPVDLKFEPGQLTFIVGGNGSGKTTLAKMLVGLYLPESGDIRINGNLVDDSNRDDFRQHFTAVFSDFYLFESLLGVDHGDIDQTVKDYLIKLQLDHKVKVENGVLSTIDLSQGQRKRLALLTAYLEDRAVYLFDEWAADQDPVFKGVFYEVLLPELKKRGKTVIVISHDDHYFHVADRLVKLEYGQLEYDRLNLIESKS